MQDLLVFSVSWHLLRREHVLDASTSYKIRMTIIVIIPACMQKVAVRMSRVKRP